MKKYICPEIDCDDFNNPDECPHGVEHYELPECFKYPQICSNCVDAQQ